jgi:hypothetical protein
MDQKDHIDCCVNVEKHLSRALVENTSLKLCFNANDKSILGIS